MLYKFTEKPRYSPILLNRLSTIKTTPSILKAGNSNITVSQKSLAPNLKTGAHNLMKYEDGPIE